MSQVWDELARERQGRHDPPGSLPDRIHARLRERIARWAATLPPGSTVLDLGCGAGLLALRLVELRPDLKVIGMDHSQAMLQAAYAAAPSQSNPTWMLGDARRWPLADQSVDAVLAVDLLAHLTGAELAECIAEGRRVGRAWLVLELKDPGSLGLLLWARTKADRWLPRRLREFALGRRTLTERIPVHVHRPERVLPPGPHARLRPWPLLPAPSQAYVIDLRKEAHAHPSP